MSGVDVVAAMNADIAWRKAAHAASSGEYENDDNGLQRAIAARTAIAELIAAAEAFPEEPNPYTYRRLLAQLKSALAACKPARGAEGDSHG